MKYSPVDVSNDYFRIHSLWQLPGIFSACKTTYDESRETWLRKSTIQIGLKEPYARAQLERVNSNARGLRVNKNTNEGYAYLQGLLKFSRICIYPDTNYTYPHYKKQVTHLEAALSLYSQAKISKSKEIFVDLSRIAHACDAPAVIACIEKWLPNFPALKLRAHFPGGAYHWSAEDRIIDFLEKHEDRVLGGIPEKPISEW